MKRAIILLGFCSLMFNEAVAQEQQPTVDIYSKEYVVARTNDFSTYFSLDESGRQKVMGILYQNNLDEIELQSKSSEITADEMDAKKKNLMTDLEIALKGVVGDDKWNKYEEYKKVSVYF